MNLPSQASLAAPSTWLHPRDTALDTERIGREGGQLEELANAEARRRLGFAQDATLSDAQQVQVRVETGRLGLAYVHPVTRWMRGDTRYNLDAPLHVAEGLGIGPSVSMRDYLRPGIDPLLFVLRPLDASERSRIDPLIARASETNEGYRLAVKLGCIGIENGKADELEWRPDALGRGGLADEVINRMAMVPRMITSLGAAVYRISTFDLDLGKP